MSPRMERACQTLVIIAALGVITSAGLELPIVTMICGLGVIVFAMLPTVIGVRS